MRLPKRILIPLDGTVISEWVLARAKHLIEQPGVSVTLLTVIKAEEERASDLSFRLDPRHETARVALANLRDRLLERAIPAEAEIRFGDPATEILREIGLNHPSLVAMSTHGRSGLNRMLFGSVALRVLQASPVPLFLFRPLQRPDESLSPAETTEPARFKNLLVPLDGSEAAEEILPAVSEFARTFGSKITLFRAIPGGSGEDEHRATADGYLRNWKYSLSTEGLDSGVEIRTGPAAQEALVLLHERKIDAVAMTTHGHTGLSRAIHGSVTERIIAESGVPVLTLRNRRLREALPSSLERERFLRVG
jgi:nucleotide-binding universal stress UspA family protein